MLDPYRMVVVNVISSVIFGILLFFYCKRSGSKPNYLLILLLLSVLPLVSMLRKGTYESGDLSLNVYKTMDFYNVLREGIILPAWAPNLNATHGYPLFIFTYPLPYYLAAFFHTIGFSFIASIKLVLASTFVLSGIVMYYWMKEEISELAGFVAAVFYLFAPYHLIDMHFRATIGEMTAYVFLPLSLLATFKVFSTKNRMWYFLLLFSLSFLILSHQAISLVSFPVVLMYGFLLWKKNNQQIKRFFIYFSSFFISMLVTAFYWLPVVVEGKVTHQAENAMVVFPKFSDFIYSPWRYGLLFQGSMGELSYLYGYAQWALIVAACIVLIRNYRSSRKNVLLLYALSILTITTIMMLSLTEPLWYVLPFMKNFQFAYRLLLLVTLCTAVIAGIVLPLTRRKWLITFVCAAAVLSTILNWGNRRSIPEVTDKQLQSELPISSYIGEGLYPAMPSWTDPIQPFLKDIPEAHIEVVSGNATIKETKRTSVLHEYTITAKTAARIKENTLYFPGWTVHLNGKPIDVNYKDTPQGSSMLFAVPRGTHRVRVAFEDTRIRKLAKTISTLTLISLGAFFYQFMKKRRITKPARAASKAK